MSQPLIEMTEQMTRPKVERRVEFSSVRAINTAVDAARWGNLQGKTVYARVRDEDGDERTIRVSQARTHKAQLEVRFQGVWYGCAWADVYTS